MRHIEVYGRQDCTDTKATREHLDSLGVDYSYVDITADQRAAQKVEMWNAGVAKTPTIRLSRSEPAAEHQILAAPSDTELDFHLDRFGLLPLERTGDGSPGV